MTRETRDLAARTDEQKEIARMESRHRLEEALRESEERYRALLGGVQDHAVFTMDTRGQIVSWDARAERIKGYTADEIVGRNFSCFFPPEDIAQGRPTELLRIAAAGFSHEERSVRVRKDGSRFQASVTITALRDGNGALSGFSELSHDVGESIIERERAQVTLNSIADAIVCTDVSGNLTFLNLVAEQLTGWSMQEAVGRPVAEVLQLLDTTSRRQLPNPMRVSGRRNRSGYQPSDSILLRRDGSELPIEDSVAPIQDQEGRTTGAVIVFRDVTAARAMSLQMTHAAHHDFLTGLPNRLLLNDRISQAITLAPRHGKQVAVLFLDVDGLKHINDSLGHPIGDKLLQSIAQRLLACVRASDTVSRQGGDEFVVLLSEVDRSEDAAITARRMLQAVAEAHHIEQQDIHISVSVGISVYPEDGLGADLLIKNADTAMYQAKESVSQGYRFFKADMNVRAVERQSLEDNLRRALERQEFVLHYQPKIDLATGAITGAEALIRWNHPSRGLIPPSQFIPVAEECGLILPIGNWVLREACKQASTWVDAGLPMMTIAVNVSAVEFADENFLEGVFDVLNETGLDPGMLELELTESVLMKRVESTASILQTLRKKGVQVAIDDFGTGYSSLSYLRKFPVDSLKIDQSFVRQISADEEDTTIVTAVISLARSRKLRVVAEGVEHAEELAFLEEHRCDEAQGYYFSRPVPPMQFAKLLERGIPVTRLPHPLRVGTDESFG